MRSGKMAIAMAVMGLASMASASTILMHVGSTGAPIVSPSGDYWNQVTGGSAVALVNSDGSATTATYSAAVASGATASGPLVGGCWAGLNGNGPTGGYGSLPTTSKAVKMGFFTSDFSALDTVLNPTLDGQKGQQIYNTNSGGYLSTTCTATLVTINGLAPSTSYNVYFYANRGSSSGVRTGLYTLTGASSSSVVFDGVADGNAGNVGQFLNAQTNATGTFTLDVRDDTTNNNANGFCYLGVLEIAAVPEPTSLALVGMGSLALLKRRRD
jgi:hypothetical protein